MRRVVLLCGFLFWLGKLFSQDLVGEWKGAFTDERDFFFTGKSTTIRLYFSKINDTTYQAFSVTYTDYKKNRDSAICILRGVFWKKNILYLEETKPIKYFPGEDSITCLQSMKLNFYKRKKQLLLTGDWYSKIDGCGYGSITLIKKL